MAFSASAKAAEAREEPGREVRLLAGEAPLLGVVRLDRSRNRLACVR